jgi:uncharacterized protein YuzE
VKFRYDPQSGALYIRLRAGQMLLATGRWWSSLR